MCTRSGFGLVIGYCSIVIYSIILIVAIGFLADKKLINRVIEEITQRHPDINIYATTIGIRIIVVFVLIVGVLMTIVSCVLVKGILKKRHLYLVPWLLITFVHIVGSFIYNFVVLLTSPNPAAEFIVGMLGVVLQCVIFYPIHKLYREMRKTKFERSGEKCGESV